MNFRILQRVRSTYNSLSSIGLGHLLRNVGSLNAFSRPD